MNLDNFKIQIRKMTEFSEDECSMFLPYLKRKELKKGELLLREGQPVREIAFIEKGAFRIYHLMEGKEINNHFFLENDYAVSFLDFLKNRSSRYYIEALEDRKFTHLIRNRSKWLMKNLRTGRDLVE